MVDGIDGTSGSLTVHEAASVFEGLLSEEENSESTETQNPRRKDEESEDNDQPEPVESEDESEEVDGDEDEGEADDEDAVDEDEPDPKPRKIRIKNEDGSDGEVDEEEASKGYMRTADYTRKTQALAEARKKFESEEMPTIRASRQKLVERLAQVEETFKALVPQEPDWDKLQAEHPDEFPRVWAAWQQHQARLNKLASDKAEAQKQIDEDNARQLSEYANAERERLLEAVPEWKNPEIAKKEKTELVSYALKTGFTEDQLKAVVDHKVLVMLRKAMLFDRAQSAKPAVQQRIQKVKVATPGPSSKGKVKVSESTRALQRLAKTGRREDVQSAFEKMLDEEDFK